MPTASLPAPAARQRFRRRLLSWYRANGRDLPWRRHRRSVPHPGVGSDAAADAGRSRAAEVPRVARASTRRSRRCAGAERRTSARRGGRSATTSGRDGCSRSRASRWRVTAASCPSDEETLLSFKGIGAYTAGAIRSFAFGQRAANPRHQRRARAVPRLRRRGDVKAHAMKRQLWALSEALVPRKHVFDFNQALMDFGATVCVAAGRSAACARCAGSAVRQRRPGRQRRPVSSQARRKLA